MALGVRIWNWVVEETARDLECTVDDARGKARCIWLLDCWPVNLTDKFKTVMKQRCPGMDIRYIPAGYTGQVQVGFLVLLLRVVVLEIEGCAVL